MTIKVFVEASPLVVDLEFPNGIEKGGCVTLIVTGPGQKLFGEEKLGIQFSHVNNDIIPVVRTVTVEDDLSACLQTLQKVRIEATPDGTGTPPCIVKLVPNAYPEKEGSPENLEFPPIGKVLDCLPGSMFPAGSPGMSGASSDDDLHLQMEAAGSQNSEDFQDIECISLDNSEDVDNPQDVQILFSGQTVRSQGRSVFLDGSSKSQSQGNEAKATTNLVTCTVCDFSTESADDLRYHIRLHAVQGELCCKVCKEQFHTMQQFKDHCDTHTKVVVEVQQEQHYESPGRGPPTLQCCACPRTFSSASALQAHEKSHFEGPPRGDHDCEECGKSFTSYRGLRMHQRRHTRERGLLGTVAEASPGDQASPSDSVVADNSVLMDMVPLAEASFSCPLCGKQFDRELKRDHHVVRKHTKAYPLQCTMCRRGFMFRKNLDKHFQDTHSCHYLLITPGDQEMAQEMQQQLLKCNYCAFATAVLEEMQSHLGTHPEIRFFACDRCDKEFSSEVRYKRHVESRQCEVKPQCEVCGKCLSSMTALRNHRLCHGQDKSFPCEGCGESFKTSTTLKYHMQAKHGELKAFKCEHCSKGFNFLAQKKRHVSRVHLRQTNHVCNLCPMKFMTKRELMLHLLCGHKFQPSLSEKGAALMPDGTNAPSLKLFQCEHCDYASYSRKGYLRHLVDHTGVWPFACDLCGKGFIERNQAERHIRTSHTTESYPCPNCPRVFVLPSSFQEHMQAHQENTGSACPQCDKYFETQGLFDLHLQAHSRELHYRCQACGQGFNKIASLNFHMIVHKHEKGGPNTWAYACEVCKKRFKYPGSLAAHRYKHSQDALHKCDLCHLVLRTQGLFDAHMRRHRGEKPYKCPYCDKAFTLVMSRRHHVTRFHTGDYHIFCPLCSKGVVSNKMLRRHLYHVHGTVLAKRKGLSMLKEPDQMLPDDGVPDHELHEQGLVDEGGATDTLPTDALLLGAVESVHDIVEGVVETVQFH